MSHFADELGKSADAPSRKVYVSALALNIPKELAAIRMERNISRSYVAARIGVTKSLLGKWERGDVDVGFSRLVEWARALGYELDLIVVDGEAKCQTTL